MGRCLFTCGFFKEILAFYGCLYAPTDEQRGMWWQKKRKEQKPTPKPSNIHIRLLTPWGRLCFSRLEEPLETSGSKRL